MSVTTHPTSAEAKGFGHPDNEVSVQSDAEPRGWLTAQLDGDAVCIGVSAPDEDGEDLAFLDVETSREAARQWLTDALAMLDR